MLGGGGDGSIRASRISANGGPATGPDGGTAMRRCTFVRKLPVLLALAIVTGLAAVGGASADDTVPRGRVSFGVEIAMSPQPAYAGGSGTYAVVLQEDCWAAEHDPTYPGGETLQPCGVSVANGRWSTLGCTTGTISGDVTLTLAAPPRTVTFPFVATLAGGAGALVGPDGAGVPNANESTGPQPGPNALVNGTVALTTIPRSPDPAATGAGACYPNEVSAARWSIDAQVAVQSDPQASENSPGDPVFGPGVLPVSVVDADNLVDKDLEAAKVATVGFNGDTGPFVMPPLNDPNGGSGRTCKRAPRDDRSGGPPAASSSVQVVYFVPSDVTAGWYDLPIVCDDGYRAESSIGYALTNVRDWMASQHQYSSQTIQDKAYKRLRRTVTAYNRTFTVTDVMFVRSTHPQSYFATITAAKIGDELTTRGWNVNGKYAVFADVENPDGVSGAGQYRGRFAIGFRRVVDRDASGNVVHAAQRWGCATDGDTTAAHEITHTMGAVPSPTSDLSDYDPSHPRHVKSTGDLMYYKIVATLSGEHTNGTATSEAFFDPLGASYTGAVLGFGTYLEPHTTYALHAC